MNYEGQLAAFYSNLNYNPVSVIAKSVYESILYVAYCANRLDDLSIANSRLAALSGGITIKQLQNARNELLNKHYILYKKGANQNNAPRYSVVRLYKDDILRFRKAEGTAVGMATGMAEGTAVGMAEGYINTKLNLLFNYLNNGQADFFEDNNRTINAKEKIAIIMNLKRLDLYVENPEVLNLYTEQSLIQTKIFYWIIKELYFRPAGIYLKDLSNNLLAYKYLKAKQYTNAAEKFDIEAIISYTITSVENELIERNKKCQK